MAFIKRVARLGFNSAGYFYKLPAGNFSPSSLASRFGRIWDKLAKYQHAETTNLMNRLDRDIHALRLQLEAAKYDVIKYCIGTLVLTSAVGLAVIRI